MTGKPFQFSIQKKFAEGLGAVVRIDGFLDAHTVGEFESQINQLMAQGTRKIVIDLAGLSYISSAGIGAMMGLTQRLRAAAGDIVLLKPSQKVFRILKILGFTEIFKIADSEDKALVELHVESS